MKQQRLLFIYNADSQLALRWLDAAHKTISPSTYKCDLCKLTYGATQMKKEWQSFITKLPIECTFIYHNQIEAYNIPTITPPAVILQRPSTNQLLITAETFKTIDTLASLQEIIKSKLKSYLS